MRRSPDDRTPLSAEQADIVARNLGLVGWGVGRANWRWPHLKNRTDDLWSAAGMALVFAARDHDPAKGSLATIFTHKLRGEVTMLRHHETPRGYRSSKRRDAKPPPEPPPATFTMHNVAGTGTDLDMADESETGTDPLDVLIAAEEHELAAARLHDLIDRAGLSPGEREAMELHDGLTGEEQKFKDIAARKGITRQAISARRQSAIRKIRKLVAAEAAEAKAEA